MINSDTLLERLRERLDEPTDSYNHGHCDNCQADLTATDVEAGACTGCHSALDDDDEDLAEEYDWLNANGMFDDNGLLEAERDDYTWDGYSHGED